MDIQQAREAHAAAGRDARLKRLAAPRTELWERCALQRAEQDAAGLLACTFQPRTLPAEGARCRETQDFETLTLYHPTLLSYAPLHSLMTKSSPRRAVRSAMTHAQIFPCAVLCAIPTAK